MATHQVPSPARTGWSRSPGIPSCSPSSRTCPTSSRSPQRCGPGRPGRRRCTAPTSTRRATSPRSTRTARCCTPRSTRTAWTTAGRSARTHVEQHLSVLADAGVTWPFRYLAGRPDRALTHLARTVDAAAFVVGTRAPGPGRGCGSSMDGSVAVRLTHHQHRPVLIVPLEVIDWRPATGAEPRRTRTAPRTRCPPDRVTGFDAGAGDAHTWTPDSARRLPPARRALSFPGCCPSISSVPVGAAPRCRSARSGRPGSAQPPDGAPTPGPRPRR